MAPTTPPTMAPVRSVAWYEPFDDHAWHLPSLVSGLVNMRASALQPLSE